MPSLYDLTIGNTNENKIVKKNARNLCLGQGFVVHASHELTTDKELVPVVRFRFADMDDIGNEEQKPFLA